MTSVSVHMYFNVCLQLNISLTSFLEKTHPITFSQDSLFSSVFILFLWEMSQKPSKIRNFSVLEKSIKKILLQIKKWENDIILLCRANDYFHVVVGGKYCENIHDQYILNRNKWSSRFDCLICILANRDLCLNKNLDYQLLKSWSFNIKPVVIFNCRFLRGHI